jgi:hypothetical protein
MIMPALGSARSNKATSSRTRPGRARLAALLAAASAAWLVSLPAATAQAAAGPATASIGSAARATAVTPITRTTAVTPPGRKWASFAYDPACLCSVLFGGDNSHTTYGDTWTRTGASWTDRAETSSPSARTGAAMVYDPASQQLLLFGGSTGIESGFQDDTWIWSGATWTELHPATSPPARHNADMVYDAASQSVLLFGGYDGSYLNDTWSWNGTTWTQLSPATSPSPRDSESLVYDQATGTAIMFGGYSSATGRLSDTWSWNGTTWTQLSPATSPGVVTVAWQAAYDAATQQVLLFGGDPGNGAPPQNGTWAWNGTTWTELSPATSPPGRAYGSLGYNQHLQRIVMFAGTSNGRETRYPTSTWDWNGTTWQRAG